MGTLADDQLQLQRVLDGHDAAVFFGGAGVSTESGIPDFRSPTGALRAREDFGFPPEQILSANFFTNRPDVFFRYYRRHLLHPTAQPHAAHQWLARAEQRGSLTGVITQNIDGLHRAAGSKIVHELHGSVHRNTCTGCRRTYSLGHMLLLLDERGQDIPLCECGDPIKPDVVLYGEALPTGPLHAGLKAIRQADVMIVGGTSLSVYPAAGLVEEFSGRVLVVINREPTPADRRAQLVIRHPIGEVLAGIR